MKLNIIIVVFISITLVVSGCRVVTGTEIQMLEESEPNDDFAAYDTLPATGIFIYGSIDSTSDEDYYKIKVLDSNLFRIKVKWVSGYGLNLAYTIYDSTVDPPISGTTTDISSIKEDEIGIDYLDEDDYNYIRIFAGNNGIGKYKLAVEEY